MPAGGNVHDCTEGAAGDVGGWAEGPADGNVRACAKRGVRTVASPARSVTAAVAAAAVAALAAKAAVSQRERQAGSALLLRHGTGWAPVPPALPPGRVMRL